MSGATFWRGGNDTIDSAVASLNADMDQFFALLSHPRRRALLYLLSETDKDTLWTANLAIQLARLEAEGSADPNQVAEEIALSLRHNHLPKLADVGLVDVDSSMTTLSYEGDDRLDDLLEWSRPKEAGRTRLPTE